MNAAARREEAEASPRIVQCLVDGWPGALQQGTGDGSPPLYLAALVGDLDVVELLARADPRALRAREENGFLPLRCAAWDSVPRADTLNIVEFLSREWSDALRERDDDGYLPLHLAAVHASLEAVQSTPSTRRLPQEGSPFMGQSTGRRWSWWSSSSAPVGTQSERARTKGGCRCTALPTALTWTWSSSSPSRARTPSRSLQATGPSPCT